METLTAQPGGLGVSVGPGPMSPRRVRGRRESKVAYRNINHINHNIIISTNNNNKNNNKNNINTYTNTSYSSRQNQNQNQNQNHAAATGHPYPSSPDQLFNGMSNDGQFHTQPANLDLAGFQIHHSPNRCSNAGPLFRQSHQDYSDDTSWLLLSSPTYTLASNQSSPPRHQEDYGGNHAQPPSNEIPQVPDTSWTITTPRSSNVDSDIDGMSDMPIGSFGSLDTNNMMFPAGNTTTSSISDTYVFPMINSHLDTSGGQPHGLELPEEFHHVGQSFDASSPGATTGSPPFLEFENDFSGVSPSWNNEMLLYGADAAQWSPSTSIPPLRAQHFQTQSNPALFLPNNPWNSQHAQASTYQQNASTGGVAFGPLRDTPYHQHVARHDFLDTLDAPNHATDPVSPMSDNGWAIVSNPPSSYAPSHDSPESQLSPPSHTSSPPRHQIEIQHTHIYHTIPGPPKAKLLRGRQRGLTAVEKKQARDVREAKACWACHISKTKCSPCSPGKPCEQCARLAGKRRFCLFSCFNDPLETLSTFLVPSYLMGHFTKANVESFVTRNASSWGTQFMCIRMDWGYRKLLQANVVALALRSSSSEMGFHHQTMSSGNTRPLLVRKSSPPLGIPLAAMDEMQVSYSTYIQDIVQSDFAMYLPTAYADQVSDLPRRLLGAVASYYGAGSAADNEAAILRRALEMHVTSVILERSLFLDQESLHKVQDHLHQEFPQRSAPRCAQRQIKLAFFLLQQRRIRLVLKDWGSLMWSTNTGAAKDKEWATAFSVFLTLILVMDKTLGAAYYFCEGRIKHYGHQASTEREAFQDLVRLTQRELFDRCKEIFHWKFKSRKGGKEACNPIRDGVDAFQGKSKTTDRDVIQFVDELRKVVEDFEQEIRSHGATDRAGESEYTDGGRLAGIFLHDLVSSKTEAKTGYPDCGRVKGLQRSAERIQDGV
ncbi:Fungal Zn binuclear cluster domain containing protein [Diplocarpon rosae]|nr:Fungal Zn binuclear cluster domain containing protein [Diplocarpon rosae]